MSGRLKLEFAPFATPAKGVLVLFCEEGVKFGPAARRALAPTGDLVVRAAAADRFKGKSGSALDLVAPPGLDVSRLVVIGVGKASDLKAQDFVKLGGGAMGKIPATASEADMLNIQLDDRAVFLGRWQKLLMDVLAPEAIAADPRR